MANGSTITNTFPYFVAWGEHNGGKAARRGAVAKNATQLRNGGGAGAESNTPSAGDFDSRRLRIDRHEALDITSVGDERMRIPADIRM